MSTSPTSTRWRTRVLALGLAGACLGCPAAGSQSRDDKATAQSPKTQPHAEELHKLREFEEKQRRSTDFGQADADPELGSDPFDIVPLETAEDRRYVGVLRGSDALVLLDAQGAELNRRDAPRSPSGLSIGPKGRVWVSGEYADHLARYVVGKEGLGEPDTLPLGPTRGVRDIAVSDRGVVYVVEEVQNRVLALPDGDIEKMSEVGRCRGPISIAVQRETLVAACLFDHALRYWTLAGDSGLPTGEPKSIEHDGPIWSFDWVEPASADAAPSERLIVAAGVEDRPLDRSDGSFGYIDSFLYVYRDGPTPTRIAELNLSELGVVTPKVVRARPKAEQTEIVVGGYGNSTWARLTLAGDKLESSTFAVPPGATALGGNIVANPLLDAWIVLGEGESPQATVVPVPDESDRRELGERIGEALFFTTLMAPWNEADGRASRFTCETCHFEGYGDGRIHFTGREDVHAVSKPLRGLFNNRPHFSRALDRSMTQMVHNEFRVANKASGQDPWFDIDTKDFDWLAELVRSAGAKKPLELPPRLTAFDLRKALMQFLMIFGHRPNPAIVGRDAYSDLETEGEQLFLDHCESCHKAKLITDDLIQFVDPPFHPVVFAENGPVVWANSEYKKTGIEPYVHPDGARIPSLRRLYKKRPYFTNGSAKELSDVLETAGYIDGEFQHHGADKTLGEKQREALAAFLALL